MAVVAVLSDSAAIGQSSVAGANHIPSLFDNESEYGSSDSEPEIKDNFQPKHIPLNDALRVAPQTYSQLLGTLLPRLQPNPEMKGATVEEQQDLSQILIGELASQFTLIQHQINDPFLSPDSNRELHRRIIVRVCSIIEDLYGSYILKAAKLRNEGVLNHSAQMSRLRAQLILQANKSLDIPLIRRCVLQHLRKTPPSSHLPSQRHPNSPPSTTQVKYLDEIKKIHLKHPKLKLPRGYIEEVNPSGLCNIKTTEVVELNTCTTIGHSPNSTGIGKSSNDVTSPDTSLDLSTSIINIHMLRRAPSEPILYANTLLQELGMKQKTKTLESDSETRKRFLKITRSRSVDSIKGLRFFHQNEIKVSGQQHTRMGDYTNEMLRKDLMDLAKTNIKVPCEIHKVEERDLEHHTTDDTESQNSLLELSPLLAANVSGLSTKQAKRLKQYMSQFAKCDVDDQTSIDNMELIHPSLVEEPPLMLSTIHIPQLSFDVTSLESSAAGIHSDSAQNTHSINREGDQFVDSLPQFTFSEASQTNVTLEEGNSILDLSSQKLPFQFQSAATLACSSHQLVCPSGVTVKQELDGSASALSIQEMLHSKNLTEDREEKRQDQLEKENNFRSEFKSQQEEPQPDIIPINLPRMDIARATGHRVSDRSPLYSLRLQSYPAIYNELTGDLDDITIEQLDSGLQEGEDIQQVYKELSQTFSKDHLSFEKDPALQPSLDCGIEMTSVYASSSLQRRKNRRVINQHLCHSGPPPWQEDSHREWINNFHTEQSGMKETSLGSRGKGWKKWWRATLTTDDYLRFIAQQGSDFLGVVHHMYDSSGSDSEDEQRKTEKRDRLKKLHEQLKEKERMRLETLQQKNSYISGQWNVNTVLMGGLGKDPDNEDVELQEQPHTKDIQTKLERIWERLLVPQDSRINMAIQYSNPKFSIHLSEVFNLWEASSDAVEQRENALRRLESFEEHASSPSRHFSKTNSTVARLKEAKTRNVLHQQLDKIDRQVISCAKKLRQFNNVLTYKGRDYLEKMSMDRTEMLYSLHQKRRQAVLQPAIQYLNTATTHSNTNHLGHLYTPY